MIHSTKYHYKNLGEYIMIRRFKSLVAIMLVTALFASCAKTSESTADISTDTQDTIEEKEKVFIPAIGYYWAKEDGDSVYYFADKKLWKYDTVNASNEVVTENLIDPYDFAVYDGTIFTLENSGEEINPLRLYIYDAYADQFDELMTFKNQVHDIIISDHYLIATTDSKDAYEIYDITAPDAPKIVDVNDIEIVKDTPVVSTDEYNENIIYQDKSILSINQLEADSIEVWGWNNNYAYVSVTIQGDDKFYKINLKNTEEIINLADDTAKVAVFEDTILTKNKDGLVEIENL